MHLFSPRRPQSNCHAETDFTRLGNAGRLQKEVTSCFLRMTAAEIATYDAMRLRLQKREVE